LKDVSPAGGASGGVREAGWLLYISASTAAATAAAFADLRYGELPLILRRLLYASRWHQFLFHGGAQCGMAAAAATAADADAVQSHTHLINLYVCRYRYRGHFGFGCFVAATDTERGI
jgi:hypothetical protein